MRWQPGTSDQDIEDRRGAGRGRVPGGGMGLGLGGVLLIGILSLVFKQDFFSLLDQAQSGEGVNSGMSAPPATTAPGEDQRYQFVKFVMNDAQDTWTQVLPASTGVSYPRAKLVLFRDAVDSACGAADAASGPFYCPGDQKVYIDLSFYDELKTRFGAAGDFAQAYVIAHEIGHHVQNILGLDERMRQARRSRPETANAVSVQLELQADCLAGVWGHSTSERKLLEEGDIDEALNAAAAIGDDHIQRMSGRAVQPDAFTHGSSADRVAAFRRGWQNGSMAACGVR